MSNSSSEETNRKIIRYYKHLTSSYQRYSVGTNNLHYGYWKGGNQEGVGTEYHREALERMNRVVAETAQIRSGDSVLDAGCGMGGSTAWLAKTLGCRVTGITLCEQHIPLAEYFVRENNVEHLCNFFCEDFCDTGFTSSSFDVFWALESSCYAVDKSKFIQEAVRLLKPRGRLVIADGFLKKENLFEQEKELINSWMRGWAVPNVLSSEQCSNHLEKNRFEEISFIDITENIMPTSKAMHKFAKVVYPVAFTLHSLGLWSKQAKEHWYAASKQFHLFSQGIACYGIISARKSI